MRVFTVSFFGHRQIDNLLKIEQQLENIVRELLLNKEYVEFLVGRSGEFDLLVSSVIHKCKRTVRNDNSAFVLVLPYLTAEYKNNEEGFCNYYDEIEICEQSGWKHYKSVYQIRNRSMVDRSDMVVLYVKHFSGGAYQTMKYAIKSNTKYIMMLE